MNDTNKLQQMLQGLEEHKQNRYTDKAQEVITETKETSLASLDTVTRNRKIAARQSHKFEMNEETMVKDAIKEFGMEQYDLDEVIETAVLQGINLCREYDEVTAEGFAMCNPSEMVRRVGESLYASFPTDEDFDD